MQTPSPTTKIAVFLWSLAVLAGITETALAVTSIVRADAVEPDLWLNIGLRSLVFAVAALLIVQYAKGRNWARIALTIMLGGIGLASMAIPTALGMLDGDSFAQATAGDLGTPFVIVRVVHLASVIMATILTLLPRHPLDGGTTTGVSGQESASGQADTESSTETREHLAV